MHDDKWEKYIEFREKGYVILKKDELLELIDHSLDKGDREWFMTLTERLEYAK